MGSVVSTKEKKSRYDRERYLKNRDKYLAYQRKHTYGITEEEFRAFGDVCEICGGESVVAYGTRRALDVDHDHDTGKNRGVLCSSCNFGLGNFKDSIFLLNAAVAYLWRHYGQDAIPSRKCSKRDMEFFGKAVGKTGS